MTSLAAVFIAGNVFSLHVLNRNATASATSGRNPASHPGHEASNVTTKHSQYIRSDKAKNNDVMEKKKEENHMSNNDSNQIAYAISLTGCGDSALTDGGAVLKHSVHLSSALNPNSGSKYGYKMYAIVHPDATECSKELEDLGYELLIRDVPVAVEDIQGDYLRKNVKKNGCCGEKEFIKLWAYTLTNHPIVVHLDLDTMVLQPMDDLFDGMLLDPNSAPGKQARSRIPVMFGKDMPDVIDAYFTRDYNMNNPNNDKPVLVQGGFLVIRPSMEAFEKYQEIIRIGDFRGGSGWGGLGYVTYGAMTFQGIVPYFYDAIVPDTATEVSRCIYNAQADNPRTLPSHTYGDCRDGQPDCQDCRESDISTIVAAHFTLCQKPWNCLPHNDYDIRHKLCRMMHHEWFRIRKDLEDTWYAKTMDESIKERQKGNFQLDQFYGFCNRQGARGYINMIVPKSLK